ncbi:hypothetical protein OESDEN_23003, partial [Oesophagostomum dentatum]
LDLFKQRYGLRLRALSWVSVCYDLPFSYHVIKSTANASAESDGRSGRSAPSPLSNQSSLICATFHVSNPHRCPVSTFTAAAPSLSLFLPLILALFLENQR